MKPYFNVGIPINQVQSGEGIWMSFASTYVTAPQLYSYCRQNPPIKRLTMEDRIQTIVLFLLTHST